MQRFFLVIAVLTFFSMANGCFAVEPCLIGKVKFRILDLKKSTKFESGSIEDHVAPGFRTRVTRVTVEVVGHEFTDEQKQNSPNIWKFFEANSKELDIVTYLNNPDNKDLLRIYKEAIKKGLVFTGGVNGDMIRLSNGKEILQYSMTAIPGFPKVP